MTSTTSSESSQNNNEYWFATQKCGVIDRSDMSRVRISGVDALELLDRLSTKKRKTVLDKMINLSEKDSLKSISSMLNSGETQFIKFLPHLHPQYFSSADYEQHICDECKRFFE